MSNNGCGDSTVTRRDRIVKQFEPGDSTAAPSNVRYRLGKLKELGLLRGRWLDCGCATGGYTVALVEMGVESAVGVDPDEARTAEAASAHRANPVVQFQQAEAESLPFPDASFDGVLLNEVLEHVRSERQTLREIYRVLKPAGRLAIMVPNRGFPFEGHGMHIGSLNVNIPIPFLAWVPQRIGRHLMRARNYWPRELHDLVNSQEFEIQHTSFLFPTFEVYPWLPARAVARYRQLVPELERTPLLRRMGNSYLLIAQKPPDNAR